MVFLRMRSYALGMVILIALFVLPLEAIGQQQRMSFLRDAETEALIREIGAPIFRAAGLNAAAIDIYLVDSPSLNAFVTGGQNIFFNTGMFTHTESVAELLGVLAHEAGHIAGGHLARGQDAIETASRAALLTTLLGVAAAIAAQDAGLGAAVVAGGNATAQNTFLSFSRAMESAADQAALTYLENTGLPATGLLTFMERLEDQELLPASQQVEYTRTHPLSRDRVDTIRRHVERSRVRPDAIPAGWDVRFERVQAKLVGYQNPVSALRLYPASNLSIAARYGRSVALWRRGRVDESLALLEQLSAQEPANPFFNELIGQIRFEEGDVQAARPYYERALAQRPNEAQFLMMLGQIRLAGGAPDDLSAAVGLLGQASRAPGGATPLTYRLLATAHGRMGNLPMANLFLAEEAFTRRDYALAREMAERAVAALPQGSAGHQRALDIVFLAERGLSRSR